ncbi:helix-turn-helix transcriptional regulator [Cryptosporangium phraense]|uniref:Helix-turn-helix transcriptional regulator n=1 Tax=Cryptosporangium phraense TaxID=2593070 RepID=A0A545AS05_9ACTN|nr:LuxR family transcriptional regulator [Cryptosporangium phraense]TQS43465.1 helix-turn-helix transcriptional regulator [Cryptosporangium phraense]
MPVLHGRAGELGVITAALAAVGRGRGGTIVVAGAPGSGRTALLAEAVARAPGHGVTPLTELPVEPSDRPATLVLDLAERLATPEPRLLVIDDLQARSGATLHVLRALARRLAGSAILWLVASDARPASPDARATLSALAEAGTELTLGPLPLDAMRALLGDLVGPFDETTATLAERCGGDPGLLVALIDALRADGALRTSAGVTALAGGFSSDRVRGLVDVRLAQLSADARATLAAAATLPPRFRADELARTLRRPPAALWGPVAELTAAALLVDRNGPLEFRQTVLRAVLAGAPADADAGASVIPRPIREAYWRFDWEQVLLGLDVELDRAPDESRGLLGAHRALLYGVVGWAEAALTETAAALAEKRDRGDEFAARCWQKVRFRLLWDAGRLTEARHHPAPAPGELSPGESGSDDPGDVIDVAVLDAAGRLALRSGDRDAYRRAVARAGELEAKGHSPYRLVRAWLTALSTDDPRAALGLAATGDLFARTDVPAGIAFDPADQPRFVRLALAAGARRDASRAVEVAEQRAGRNPRFTLLAAAAAHARGLLEDDPARLLAAAALYRETSRRLDLAAAWEDAARRGADPARLDAAAALLEQAGVRRPRVAGSGQPLTAAERQVVELIVAGVPNREVAERLHCSPHTVNARLRRAFVKLGVHSRVELLQLAADDGI